MLREILPEVLGLAAVILVVVALAVYVEPKRAARRRARRAALKTWRAAEDRAITAIDEKAALARRQNGGTR